MHAGDQRLVAQETARQLSMGTNILDPQGLPDFKVGEPVPKDLGAKYGEMCYDADGFAQVCRARCGCRRMGVVIPEFMWTGLQGDASCCICLRVLHPASLQSVLVHRSAHQGPLVRAEL